ncbi:hypothetical protein [uncultured Flavobacterium sp.]|uniref:hypothetical protein n=1 Tax=uncultured Flavobacterium sp. TaxID=165435 RepID=UPI0030CA4E32
MKLSNHNYKEYIKKLEVDRQQSKENINYLIIQNVKRQTTTEKNNSNKIVSKELDYLKSTANHFNTIGLVAFLGAILFQRN